MQEVVLLKCGELVLKGLNRHTFEDRLIKDLKTKLKNHGEYQVTSGQSTICVRPLGGASVDGAYGCSLKTFGVVSVARAAICEKDLSDIKEKAALYLEAALLKSRTFKVAAKRADKRFGYTSPEIGAEVGGFLLEKYPHLKADMENPDVTVWVEVRDDFAFVHGGGVKGAGGMPAGSAGRALVLLSGGIDSPVAAYMMAKRGIDLSCVHFFSHPYTSEQAKEKVFKLAGVLAGYSGKITVSVVPFTEIQEEIRQKCKEDYFTLIMRRMMMRISEKVADIQGCKALITGESLGQVASQTLEAIAVTDGVCEMPVFRPLIGLDKEEITKTARQIGTFDISVLPYEDCCTVFTPRHPQTKPRLENVAQQERDLNIDELIGRACLGIERVTFG